MKFRSTSTYSRGRGRYSGSRNRSSLYRRTPSTSQLHLPVASVRPLILLLGLSLILWLLFSSNLFRVTHIQVAGLRTIPESAIKEKVQEVASGSYLLIFRRDSEWLYPVSQLSKDIKQGYPALSSVQIVRKFPHTILIKVQERPVSLVWQSGDGNYLVDSDGVITGSVPAGFAPQIVVKDTTNLPVSTGKKVLSSEYISFISSVYTELPRQVGTKLTTVSLGETTLETTVTTKAGYTIFFDTTRSASAQIGYLAKILAQLKTQHQQLDYIDLRVDNRIFYKLK